MSKTLSEEIDFALCCISECCVDESKRNITSRKAIEQIREYLNVLNDDRYSKNFNVSLKREIREKDQRIAELEEELASQNSNELVKKKYDSLKEAIKFLWEKQITDEHIFYVIDQLGQQHIDRIQDIENGICEIERLEKELAELKENAIVPKFKIGDKFYYITENNKIDERLICQIKISKDFISYIDTLGVEWYCDKNDVVSSSIFTTPQEAEQKIKEMAEVSK